MKRLPSFVPKTELSVREVFAQRARRLGYRIIESRIAFPDYLLERDGERLFAEAEFRTSNFLRHRHDPAGCDLIVVWDHDLPAMPLTVLELRTNTVHSRRGKRGRKQSPASSGIRQRAPKARVDP